MCIKELNSPSFYPSMISLWVTDSFERKEMERDLLAGLLIKICKCQDSLFSQTQLIQGYLVGTLKSTQFSQFMMKFASKFAYCILVSRFESVLSSLEDAVNDAPKAAEFLGHLFARVILENIVPLGEIGRIVYLGGEEPRSLVESGLASEVLGSILEFIRASKGDSVVREIRKSSSLRLEDFLPPNPIKTNKLDAFL